MECFSKRKRTKTRACYSKSNVFPLNEGGYILFETVISLSIILIILSAMGGIIYWSIQKSKEFRGDFELSRELLFVSERLTEDANLADKVAINHLPTGDKISINSELKPGNDKAFTVYYAKTDAPGKNLSRIIVDTANAPITGNSELGDVHILNFKAKKISEHIFSIELEGISRVTNHRYTLKTAVFVQGDIVER